MVGRVCQDYAVWWDILALFVSLRKLGVRGLLFLSLILYRFEGCGWWGGMGIAVGVGKKRLSHEDLVII